MSSDRRAVRHSGSAARAGSWLGSLTGRLRRAWRVLPPERRLAVYAACGLFFTLFLPWYQETVIASGRATRLQSLTESLTGWGAFSFVEAAVLLVAVGVIVLLVQRAEGRAFHLPGGDGWVITAAGAWTCLLIIWRIFDKQGADSHGQYATTSGIEWGIFVALAVAALLTYAGSRIRAAHQPEPPLPGEPEFGFDVRASRSGPAAREAVATASAAERTAAAPERPSAAPERPLAAPTRRRPPIPTSDNERTRGWLTAPPKHAARSERDAPQSPPDRGSTRPQPDRGAPPPDPDATQPKRRTAAADSPPAWDGAPREWPLRRARPSYPSLTRPDAEPADPSPAPQGPPPVRAPDPADSGAPTRAARPDDADGDEQLTIRFDRDE
jgi:hypothetical protein